jgi:hypothetical protein
MSAVIVYIVAFIGSLVGMGHADSKNVPLPPCVGDVITVDGDADMTCDVSPPQRLDVTNVTIAECVDMGGEPIRVFIIGPTTCEGVDY